jgi:hypothetical protein
VAHDLYARDAASRGGAVREPSFTTMIWYRRGDEDTAPLRRSSVAPIAFSSLYAE